MVSEVTVDTQPPTPQEWNDAVKWAAQHKRLLLIAHERADGDSLGSLLATRGLLNAAGCSARAMVFEPVQDRYNFLPGINELEVFSSLSEANLGEVDGVVVLDTCTYSQLEPLAAWLKTKPVPILAIDHHRTRDELADLYLIDPTAAAASLLVYRWAKAAGWTITPDIAAPLYIGIAADTGWFRFSNTTPETMRAAAELMETGIKHDELFEQLYQQRAESAVRLHAAAVSGMELFQDGRVAMLTITPDMLAQTGASPNDTEDLAGAAMGVAGVEAAVLMTTMPNGLVKCSFRSRESLDVAALAATFGGGGHARAAGARLEGDLDEVKQKILTAMTERMK